MATYKSIYKGEEIDAAVGRALEGGTIDEKTTETDKRVQALEDKVSILDGIESISDEVTDDDTALVTAKGIYNAFASLPSAESGIQPYNELITYSVNDICHKDGILYVSVVDDNLGNSVYNTNYWLEYGKERATTEYEQLINYTMLYDAGDECEDVTGGWSNSDYSQSGYTIVAGTENSDNLQVVTGAGTSRIAVLGTANTIDFSGYKMLHALMEWTTGDSSQSLRAYSSKTLSGSVMAFAGFQPNTLNTKEFKSLDITEYQSSYYLVLMANTSTTASTSRGGKMYHSFLTKSDDITKLCTKADLDTPTDLDTLLADTDALATIFNTEDAVKFMVAQCTGDFMVGVLSSADAVALLKASPYLNTVIANPHWAKFIMMIPTAQELLGYTMLYDGSLGNADSNECKDVSGGWQAVQPSTVSSGWTATAPTLTKADTNMTATLAKGASRTGRIETVNTIDMSEYNLFAFIGSASLVSNTSFAQVRLYLDDTYTIGLCGTGSSSASSNTFDGLATIDITEAEGSYTPKISMHSNANTAATATVESVFLTKSDDFTTWASFVGITATDLDTLLADSASMEALMSYDNAVKYLCGCTGDLMIGILNSTTAVSAIVNSAVATLYLTEHPVWKKFIDMIPTSVDAGLNLV